ncbi:hypothetical protein HDV03_003851 [Kappamyces sp. JEL0829]|nr:hypothetical protein HDV03_003851 [Kappamyces sp. JEL0829]
MLQQPPVASPTQTETLLGQVTEPLGILDMRVGPEALVLDSVAVVRSLFPHWNRADIQAVQCTDGITNKLVRVINVALESVVLVRTYGKGSDILIDRSQEVQNMLSLHKAGLCPPLYGRFQNGIVYGYVDGQVFSVPDMRDGGKSLMVAKHLAQWHSSVQLSPSAAPAPLVYSDPLKQEKWLGSGHSLESIKTELASLQARLERLQSPVVFCHNDLLSGNIIYNPGTKRVRFIDYEYGGPSYRGFDLGNHFCEW